jgi:ACS family tartrate transporter-like MFS transporter
MIALIFAVMGQQSISPNFRSLPTALLAGTAAAGGVAMINSIGNLGGFLGPWAFGLVKDATGSVNVALFCLSSATIVSAIAVIAAGHDRLPFATHRRCGIRSSRRSAMRKSSLFVLDFVQVIR